MTQQLGEIIRFPDSRRRAAPAPPPRPSHSLRSKALLLVLWGPMLLLERALRAWPAEPEAPGAKSEDAPYADTAAPRRPIRAEDATWQNFDSEWRMP